MSYYFMFQEASEGKRKNAKRTSKSEKEFLEFTLKYQQVLAERDYGTLLSLSCNSIFCKYFFFGTDIQYLVGCLKLIIFFALQSPR